MWKPLSPASASRAELKVENMAGGKFGSTDRREAVGQCRPGMPVKTLGAWQGGFIVPDHRLVLPCEEGPRCWHGVAVRLWDWTHCHAAMPSRTRQGYLCKIGTSPWRQMHKHQIIAASRHISIMHTERAKNSGCSVTFEIRSRPAGRTVLVTVRAQCIPDSRRPHDGEVAENMICKPSIDAG